MHKAELVKTQAMLKDAAREFRDALEDLEEAAIRARHLIGSCLGSAEHIQKINALLQRRDTVGVCALRLWCFGTSCGVRAQEDQRLAHSAIITKVAELDVVITIVKRATESMPNAQNDD